jgi:hypothetical protein
VSEKSNDKKTEISPSNIAVSLNLIILFVCLVICFNDGTVLVRDVKYHDVIPGKPIFDFRGEVGKIGNN